MLVKIGSFAKTGAAAPASQAVTGVGFTPKALILWNGTGVTSSTVLAGHRVSVGFTAGASNSRFASCVAANADTSPSSGSYLASKATGLATIAGAAVNEADLTSFDSDGFTLNWTTNNANASLIGYLAFGGDDVQAKVVEWSLPTATGNQAVTGVGFRPDLVLHAHCGAGMAAGSRMDGVFGLGAMTPTDQWANGIFSKDSIIVANTDTQRVQATDGMIEETNISLGTNMKASYVSMDSDGFTVNFSTASATATGTAVSLCLKGVAAKLGSFDKTTGAATASQSIATSGFMPKAALITSFQTTTNVGGFNNAYLGMGGSSTVGAGAAAYSWATTDVNNQATSNTDNVSYTNKAFIKSNVADAVAQALADISSFNTDGMTLSWTTNDAVATEILYLLLGSLPQKLAMVGTG